MDWSEPMLMKAFTRLEDIRSEQKEAQELLRKGIDLSEEIAA